MNKIKIHLDAELFQLAQNQYQLNQEVLTEAIENYNSIIGIELQKSSEQDFQKDIYNYTIEDIKKKYADAYKLGLTVDKLCDLFNINLDKIKELSNKYKPNLKKPKETDFYIYAETPEQIERFKTCQKLCEAWESLNSLSEQKILLRFNPFVRYTDNQNDKPLIPNYYYVLNGY